MYSKTLKISALLVCLFAVGQCQIISTVSCPSNVDVVSNFNVENYLGKWFEYAKYPAIFEANGVCITAEYSLQADGVVAVLNSQIDPATKKLNTIEGTAKLVSNGKLLVNFPTGAAASAGTNYMVLDTDYSSYAVVYSCQAYGASQSATFVWILTRDPVPCGNVIEQAIAALRKNNISVNELVLTNHIACPAQSC